MRSLSRRRLMQMGIGAILLPSYTWASVYQDTGTTAANFSNGQLKGFDIGLAGRRGDDPTYFDALSKTGANVGRVFFPFKKCMSCDQWGRSSGDIAALQRILNWCHARDIKMVVAGDFEGSEQPSFWHNDSLRNSFVENWKWFARTFQNHPAIAGLDLMNEPNPPWPSGRVEDAHALWRPLAGQAIAGIRESGVTLPIIYEGVGGGQAIGLRDFLPFSDRQVVYSIHVYSPHAITHQHVGPAWTQTIPYPAGIEWKVGDVVTGVGAWDRRQLELSLRDAIAFQQLHKVPIYVGEFSCVRWAPNGSATRYVSDCLALFKQFGWSWSYHEFRGWPGWDPEIASENSSNTVRSWDAPINTLLLKELAGNKR